MDRESQTISAWRKIAFGAGDFGFNFSWQFTSVFLLYYYTDVLGLAPAIAGGIYMLALIWEAAADPLIGLLAERTRTRFGRFRPYLIFGAPVLTLAIIALTAVPAGVETGVAVAAGVTHVLFRTIYACVNIPYSAMTARITRDPHVRTDLAAARMVGANLAGVLVAITVYPAVKVLGGASALRGWALFGVGLGAMTMLFVWVCAFAMRGLDVAESREPSRTAPRQSLKSQATMVARALNNRALLVVTSTMLIGNLTVVFFSKSLIYWFEYGLGHKEASGPALAIPGLTALIFIPLWTWALKRIAKHLIAMLGAAITIGGLVLFFLVGRDTVQGAAAGIVLYAIGNAAWIVCLWSMLPDTVEYGEWKSGVRNEGLVFGVAMLVQKTSVGFGAGALGMALGAIGYRSHVAQTPETLHQMILMMTAIPILGFGLKIAILWLYPMDHARQRQIAGFLADRDRLALASGPLRAGPGNFPLHPAAAKARG